MDREGYHSKVRLAATLAPPSQMGMDVRPPQPLEPSERVGELRQSLVMSGKQIEFVEDFFVLQGGKTSTDGAR
jgi:hypothetical protein